MRRQSFSWWYINEYGRREHKVIAFIDRCFYATHRLANAFWDNVHDVTEPELPTRAEAEATDITGRDKLGRRLRWKAPRRSQPRATQENGGQDGH